ncbi:MAG: hypothetical protein CL853_07145 [Crocinitomicaceae bacterium]|nr:hypothetical protein [Crocinitomicaceae bacterium]
MNKLLSLLLVLLFCCTTTAQISPVCSYKRFLAGNQPYLEVYTEVYANSLQLNKIDSTTFSYGTQITQLLKDQKNQIIDFKKFTIEEKINTNENSLLNNILDLQRFKINNGIYSIELQINDLNDSSSKETFNQEFLIDFSSNEIELSDIELLDSYFKTSETNTTTKSGFSLIPLVNNYYSPEFNKIAYYFEIYNPNSSETDYVLTQSIRIQETAEIAGQFNKLKKINLKPTHPIINSFNINNLPTGNYYVLIQLRDHNNELIVEKKVNFQRTNIKSPLAANQLNAVNFSNTFCSQLPKDSLTEFIQCLAPIASPFELNIIDKKATSMDDTAKRKFFYSFWYNQNNIEPQKAWEDYKIQVKRIDQLFGTKIRRGYQTDRGRVYLKYGAPNNLIDRPNEPSTYPYQIWHYYRLGRFNNKRFIFYLPDLVTNDYLILHSDVPGEIRNDNWNAALNSRNSTKSNLDDPNQGSRDHWGNNSSILFNNP